MGADPIRDAICAAYDRVGQDGSQAPAGLGVATGRDLAKALGYDETTLAELPASAVDAFVGAGALAPQVSGRPGDLVVDLGCGAGLDSLLLTRRGFRVISLDASGPMLARLAKARGDDAGHPRPLRAALPEIPLSSGVARWALLNGVANLVRKRDRLLAEVHRILAPRGTLLIADLVAVGEIPEELRCLPEAWAWCLGGATGVDEWTRDLARAGFVETSVEVLEVLTPVARAQIRSRRGQAAESGGNRPGRERGAPGTPLC